jgi:hypothetical protein
VDWTPPIPSGAPAVDAWRALGPQVRKQLLAGEPHPDPLVAAVAVGYARTVLARPAWLRNWPRRVVIIALGAVAGVLGAVASSAAVSAMYAVLWVVVFLVVVTGSGVMSRRRDVALLRMENVSAARLWPVESRPVPAPLAVHGPVAFSFAKRALFRVYGTFIGVVLVFEILVWSQGRIVTEVFLTVIFGMLLAVIAYNTIRWTKPWLPPLVLDQDGISLPPQRVRVPWSEVTEIRVTPVRGGSRRASGRRVTSFMVADAEAVLAQYRGAPLKRARRSVTAYGTPFSIMDLLLERTADDIVAAAGAFARLPVRHLGT